MAEQAQHFAIPKRQYLGQREKSITGATSISAGSTQGRHENPQKPSDARGTVSASPPVQALKTYQAGFASCPSVSRPAESQN